MKPVCLVFAINNKFLPPLAVTLQSILDNNSRESFEVFVLSHELKEEDSFNLKKMFEGRGSTLDIIDVDFDQFKGLPHAYHLDLSCYFRLAIPSLINREKVIYLDADLIVRGPLRPLWEINLGDHFLAAVPDFSGNAHPDLPVDENFGYFNSGVMLLNLVKCREFFIAQKVIEFSKKHPGLVRFADQCGLNAVTKGQFLNINPKYNFQGLFYETSYRRPQTHTKEDMELAKNESLIIHFTGTKKPWHWGCKHPDRALYWKYLKKTPYKKYFPDNPTPINILRSLAPKRVIEMCYNSKNKLKRLFPDLTR